MDKGLKGKVALITGAGKRNGIGFGIAERLASAGVNIVISDLVAPQQDTEHVTFGTLEVMQELVEDLKNKYPIEAIALGMDVTSTESVDAAMAKVKKQCGRLDFLFNNAGTAMGAGTMVHEYDETAWIKTVDVNLHGVFRVSKAAVALMSGKPGAIVNVASKAGKSPAPLNGAYAASKAGVISITKVMALELGPENIRVNAICPGFIKTDLQEGNIALKAFIWEISTEEAEKRMSDSVPLKRMGSIEEVADLCAYLVSEHSSYITGQALNIGGGVLTEA
ncbi:MAG: SDR family oxidoreductase [Deltaproteobacteria bacterium]|jgi:NAD(P)-dependent dehydrogenase (short-subunit alcohol dehydrogenase family)|nr:SDR family oxidoreductase [Deltaproteobacteria bacterium]MBT4644294.1 SDR family oxidoreductase [Deltaproteobacteria bacterium]MBT6500362.1 SDR family oxidoreductase [Deltaproteobacteria bacterium]MBT6615300.1 SDR family oxidoreductase [Deltaproteobacteria bacterium]MBT7151115.1 SDR family oxidoreductase [Deltaproteobacteria bacterium]